MTDVKTVLMFISFKMQPFFVQMAANFLYFFLVLAITVPVFFFTYEEPRLFGIYLTAIIVPVWLIRRVLFFKRQLILNIEFLRFLERFNEKENIIEPDENNSGKTKLPKNVKGILKGVKEELKKSGVRRISQKLASVYTCALICGQDLPPETSRLESVNNVRSKSVTLSLMEGVIFLMLLIPFGGISLLFTLGVSWAIKLLIFIVGFIFAWFLHSAIVLPIGFLVLQKNVHIPHRMS
ncbi:MAG: hypothetical protein GY757_55175 [bacterium]|nr:hypothetical protein [bacterium]